MLVYGDHSEAVDPRAQLVEIADRLRGGWLNHDALTGCFIDLAGVAQGLADADFHACGCDRPRPAEAMLLEQLTGLASTLLRSWDQGCGGGPGQPLRIPVPLPGQVQIRLPEGYAFYALRPEAYGLAARRSELTGPPRVIGLRSIGTGLACMAAAALGAPPPLTLRPIGNPFDRRLNVAPDLERQILSGDCHYVIVDEGPGMSGSSFGAVADWLEEHGIAPERVAFLPSHAGALGPQASARQRQRWASAQRPVVSLERPEEGWLAPLIGRPSQPLTDLSGGAWRAAAAIPEQDWPSIDPMWERRKFLVATASGEWLVKFAGLGWIGERKLQLARELHLAGFGSEPAGLVRGWLVTRWHSDAVVARPSHAELTAYLTFRANLPAPGAGASPAQLLTMIRRNLPALANWSPDLDRLHPTPVCTDNRMARYEWLRLPSGQLLKADALDHHATHDLIGCQDVAWDVAGAIVELGLEPDEAGRLASATGADSALLDFYLTAYTAFRIGAHRMSASTLHHWPEEQHRHLLAAKQLERRLASVDAVEHAGDLDEMPAVGVEPGA
ncbi:hypothetical protein [uncultured Sphingomonas sp.]|uniref:hypothetical protein n=1 Tax=uncultured Sphingomonas sp. TaxID=158754 RepID=UPI0025F3BF80|nr:hypothetical protein [uncultured Sphingomonas sp.]